MSNPRTTLLEDAVDIPTWLETDRATAWDERIRRDRDIGRSLGARDDAARVLSWWRRLERRVDDLPGRRLQQARSWINLALVLIGLVGGAGLALAAFRYDGTYPVNVVRLLALLVVPQLVLLALNLFLIPGRLPGLRVLQDALSALNPGALAAAVYRQLAREPKSRVFAWAAAPTKATRRFAKWQMLYWSQIAAVAFNVGVIATAVVLIAFTDLAFGWTTTLDVDSGTAARIFRTAAAPWAGIFPESVPDDTLIERSRFFRLEGNAAFADSDVLTRWWSFSVLAVVTYGLLPRLVFLFVAGWRLRSATWTLLMGDSRVTALLDRMSAPDLETRGLEHADGAPQPAPAARTVARSELAGAASAVIWNRGVAADSARDLIRARLGFGVKTLLDAGGGSLEDERKALECLAATRDSVVVLTPAWEPPLLEFVDFLGTLRSIIGGSPSIIVVPVAEDGGAASPIERDNWSRAVAKSGDARAYVEAGDP